MGETKRLRCRLYVKAALISLGICLLGTTARALDPVVRVITSVGSFDIQLLPATAPNTVANFLRYADRSPNGYNGTFIHRVAPNFVVQGGGFTTSTFTDSGTAIAATHIPTDPPVANEFVLSNIRETVAMAKVAGNPNSATSEWFVNLVNNSANLDNTNGGFTVFGRVISGMGVVDAIAALPRIRTMGEGVPARNYTGGAATQANLVNITVTRLTGPKADFNSDGKSDFLWQNNSTGQRSVWLMDGTARASISNLGTIPPVWNVAGSGDFNADGKSDILWQNSSTGERTIWMMNGTVLVGSVALQTIPTVWDIAGAGDFNRDGKPDILWQNNSTGQRSVWLMDGTARTSIANIGTIPPVWSIAASGDFNGDVKPDLVWQNTSTGERSVWLMDGAVRIGVVALQTIPVAWSIAGAGDFNLDGKTDILWQNTSTGERSVWIMNGTARTGVVNVGQVSPQWSLRNR